MATKLANIKKMDFETAIEELESIVGSLESTAQKIDLNKAIEKYSRGMELKNHCEEELSKAKIKIEKITLNDDGTAKTSPLTEN